MENPIPHGCTDRTWVEEEIKIMVNHIESMRLEAQKENCSGRNSWVNHEPFLRLYHTLNDDEVQGHLLKQFDSKDRYKLDARNSVVRDMDFYEIAAEKFNNIYWVPTSLRLPHSHSDFSELIELPMKYHPIELHLLLRQSALVGFSIQINNPSIHPPQLGNPGRLLI